MSTFFAVRLALTRLALILGLARLQLNFRAGLDTLSARARSDDPDADRGDVPGWVMITVMTAIVVIALLAVFQDAVLTAVRNAFNSVTGGAG